MATEEISMSKATEMDVKVKFGLKSFITVVAILLAVLIAVGILTFVIPAGRYTVYTTDESLAEQPFYEYTEDESFDTYPKGYYITADSYYPLPEVQKAVFEMKVGECKMVRSENGLHVIMRYEPAEAAYALSEYEDLFIAKSTGTYIFMSDLVSKLMTDYVASYKEKVVIDKSLLDGVDIKSAGINYHY